MTTIDPNTPVRTWSDLADLSLDIEFPISPSLQGSLDAYHEAKYILTDAHREGDFVSRLSLDVLAEWRFNLLAALMDTFEKHNALDLPGDQYLSFAIVLEDYYQLQPIGL